MKSLHQQLKKRRFDLGLRQSDMMMRVGISRQQYQHLESNGNPRLNTLELIALGLNSEVMLIPREKLNAVLAVLDCDEFGSEGTDSAHSIIAKGASFSDSEKEIDLSEDSWQGLLGENS